MKKFITLILALILAFSFSACSETEDTSSAVTDDSSKVVSEDSKIPETPKKELFGTDLKNGVISADYLSIEDLNCTDVIFYKDSVLAAYTDNMNTNAKVFMFDRYTGEKLKTFDIHELYWPKIKINDKDNILFYDTFGSYYLFENADSETPQKNIIPQPEIGEDPGMRPFYQITDDFLIFITENGNIKYQEIGKEPVEAIDLSDKFDLVELKYEDSENYYFDGILKDSKKDMMFYLTKKDFRYGSYDFDPSGNVFLDGDSKIIDNYNGTIQIINGSNNFSKKEFYLDDIDERVVNCAFPGVFTLDTDSLKDSVIFKNYDYDGNITFEKTIVLDGWARKLFINSEVSDGNIIIILEASNEDLSENKDYVYFIRPEKQEIKRKTAQNAAEKAFEIEQKYGIQIYGGPSAATEFNGYKADMCENQPRIFNAMEKIEYVLEKFPEGFFGELFSKAGNEYQDKSCIIYLVGSIHPAGEDSISSAAAFTYSDSGTRKIVIDITLDYEMEINFAHELMHCIDDYITLLPYEEGKDNGFEHWNDYLPENFDYAYRYLTDDGSEYFDITYTVSDDEHEPYFVDSYSKTFPTEDRSRLFENLFREDGFPEKHPKILARAEYMCKVIRESFDTLRNAENLWWEREFESELQKAA